jgi:hypothetical protein
MVSTLTATRQWDRRDGPGSFAAAVRYRPQSMKPLRSSAAAWGVNPGRLFQAELEAHAREQQGRQRGQFVLPEALAEAHPRASRTRCRRGRAALRSDRNRSSSNARPHDPQTQAGERDRDAGLRIPLRQTQVTRLMRIPTVS